MSFLNKLKAIKKEVSAVSLIDDEYLNIKKAREEGYTYPQIHKAFCDEFGIEMSIVTFQEYYRRSLRKNFKSAVNK